MTINVRTDSPEHHLIAERLLRLRRMTPMLRVEALAEGLRVGDPAERAAIGAELIELAIEPQAPDRPSDKKSTWWKPRQEPVADAALARLAQAWVRLPGEVRWAALSIGDGRWERLEIPEARDASDKLSACYLAAETGEPRVGERLVALLGDADPVVASAADRALVLLALAATPSVEFDAERMVREVELEGSLPGLLEPRWRVLSTLERRRVGAIVAAGIETFPRHKQRGCVLAGLLMLDRATLHAHKDEQDPLGAWLHNAEHPAHAGLQGVLRWSKLPEARARAWEWMCIEHLARACADRAGRGATLAEHEAVLSRAYLLARPARAVLVAGMDLEARAGERETLLPAREKIDRLSAEARRGMARVVSAARGSVETKRTALEPLLADEDPTVRSALVRHASRSGGSRMLEDLCFDGDERVARGAMLAWSDGGHLGDAGVFEAHDEARGRMLVNLSRSPHAMVRAWAAQDLALRVERGHAGLASRLALRREIAAAGEVALTRLEARLRSKDAGERLATVALVRRLGVAHAFEAPLVAMLDRAVEHAERRDVLGVERKAAASAAAALGEVQSQAARDALVRVIGVRADEESIVDHRVRANALEALARQTRWAFAGGAGAEPRGALPLWRSQLAQVSIELKGDENHRVRGNAVRAMLAAPATWFGIAGDPFAIDLKTLRPGEECVPEAAESLRAMLADERVPHRLAGVWVAQRALPGDGRERIGVAWTELFSRVVEMAKFERDASVRGRALACADLVRRSVRGTWARGEAAEAGAMA